MRLMLLNLVEIYPHIENINKWSNIFQKINNSYNNKAEIKVIICCHLTDNIKVRKRVISV